jgi:hypothetical protein
MTLPKRLPPTMIGAPSHEIVPEPPAKHWGRHASIGMRMYPDRSTQWYARVREQSDAGRHRASGQITARTDTCEYLGEGFCAASVDGYCVGGWSSTGDHIWGKGRCHG